MTDSDSGGNNTSAKAFGGVVAIVAVIAGIFAMTEPMGQRMDFLERELEQFRYTMQRDDEYQKEVSVRSARLQEKFTEVETQLSDIERRIVDLENWLTWWYKTIPGENARMDERIEKLESKGD